MKQTELVAIMAAILYSGRNLAAPATRTTKRRRPGPEIQSAVIHDDSGPGVISFIHERRDSIEERRALQSLQQACRNTFPTGQNRYPVSGDRNNVLLRAGRVSPDNYATLIVLLAGIVFISTVLSFRFRQKMTT